MSYQDRLDVVSFNEACAAVLRDDAVRSAVAKVLAAYGRASRGSLASMPLLYHEACDAVDDLSDARRAEYFRFLLASYIVPLTFKAALAECGKYTLTDDDRVRIEAFETLATLLDHFAERDVHSDGPYPWREVLSRIGLRPVAEALAMALAAPWAPDRPDEGPVDDPQSDSVA